MKNSKAFYRSALATAIVMALSAPAFAADNAVSTTPVTLDKDKTTLEQDVVISGTTQITAATINAEDKDLNVTFGGHDITAESTADKEFVKGVKVDVYKRQDYGLAAGIVTADLNRAHRVIHQLEAGICWINTWGESPAEMPVGGYKHSGIGRENGVMTLQSYTQVKSIQVEMAKFQSIF